MKVRIELLGCLWAMLLSASLFAQLNQKTVFGNPAGFVSYNTPTTILNTSDGGWLLCNDVVGSMNQQPRLIKLNSDGQTQWDNSYLPPPGPGYYYYLSRSVLNAPDGGWMMSYRDDSTGLELLKIAGDGSVQWQKDIGQTSFGVDLLGYDGSAYISVEETFNGGANTYRLRRLDQNGNVLGNVLLPVPWTNYGTLRAVMTDNNEIQVYWWRSNSGTIKNYAVRYDAQGNQLWQNQPAGIGGANLFPAPNGGYVLVNGSSVMTRFDASGAQAEVFTVTSIPNVAGVTNVKYYPDGSFLLSGQTVTNRGYMAKIAADHSVLWVAEAPDDAQPPVTKLWGIPTPDGWGAAIGITPTEQTAFVRVFENTGITVKTLTGVVRRDFDNDCAIDNGTPGLNGAKITAASAAGDLFTAFTALDGTYSMTLPSGVFTLNAYPVNQFFYQCPDMVDTVVDLTNAASANVNFAIQSLAVIHNIVGKVAVDQNGDCTVDAGDEPVKHWLVNITGSGFTVNTLTYADGTYSAFLPNGTYDVSVEPLNQNFTVCSPAVQTVSFSGSTAQIASANFAISKAFDCALMKTWLGAGLIRPCTTATFAVYYQNIGTADADNVKLTVTLDPMLTYVSSSFTPTSINGNTLVFDFGTVSPSGNYSAVNIHATPDCNLTVGNQVCVNAQIEPDTVCYNQSNWSGAIVTIEGSCNASQTEATFKVKNIGNAANAQLLDYVIAEDQIVLFQGQFQLAPGDSVSATVPVGNGNLTGLAEQEPGFPGDTTVNYSLVNCMGMPGGANGFNGNPGPFTAQSCFTVSASFDPNDKAARPEGFGPDHVVLPGMPLDYTIRFQNTGNDTAFLVVIRDTLSTDLDASTFKMRSNSHPCRIDLLDGKILQFTFENILLPDSSTNQNASQGAVEFSIRPRADLPLGTVIGNRAAIYFDYNKPVITNTVYRKIDQYLVVTAVHQPGFETPVQVFPNPAVQSAELRLPESFAGRVLQFDLTDAAGRSLRSAAFEGPAYRFERASLPAGLYFWSIREKGAPVAAGKISLY